jgi:hypothetical protein
MAVFARQERPHMKRYRTKPPKPKSMRLKDHHTWTAPPGHKIVVIDRGLASFNVPDTWVVTDMKPFTMRDKPVPNDNAGLQVTTWNLPPGVDWTGLPLAPLLTRATEHGKYTILARSEATPYPREDIELVWMEERFIDPGEKREAFSRNAVGRGFDVQVIITLSFWVDDADWCRPIWDEVLRSLQLGRKIDDPLKGPVLH